MAQPGRFGVSKSRGRFGSTTGGSADKVKDFPTPVTVAGVKVRYSQRTPDDPINLVLDGGQDFGRPLFINGVKAEWLKSHFPEAYTAALKALGEMGLLAE